MKVPLLSHERLLTLVEYCPESGIFRNKVKRGNASPAGKVLGTKNASGHLVLQIDKEMFLAHRLAWFYCFKEWPLEILDHIDGNPENNSLDNLREANKATNNYNTGMIVTNTSGIKGAYYNKSRKYYYSQITFNGKRIYLGGGFKTPEEAGELYRAKAKELHGEFFNEDTSIL